MTFEISKEARKEAIASIERYFREDMEEPIGNIAASGLLDVFVNSLSLPPTGLLLLIMGLLLIVGCIMETTAALLLLVPVLALLTPQMQVDPVQFGVLVVVNLAIGMLTPPVGICLFVACGIADVSLGKILRAVMPLMIVAMIDLLIAALWPPLTMWLPTLFYR